MCVCVCVWVCVWVGLSVGGSVSSNLVLRVGKATVVDVYFYIFRVVFPERRRCVFLAMSHAGGK